MSDGESTRVDSSTAEKVLLSDETVIRELRPAWAAYTIPLLLITLGVIGGGIFISTLSGVARRAGVGGGGRLLQLIIPILFLGLLGFGTVYLARVQTRYIVTDKRVLKVKGLLSKATHTIWLRDVAAIRTRKSLFERLTGYGSVTVACEPISWLHRIPLLPLGNGITFGAVPEVYTVTETIEREADSLDK